MRKKINVTNVRHNKFNTNKIDTLNLVIKACLNQKHKKKYFVIYYLKKLSLIEQNYDIYDKKLLTIVTVYTFYCQGLNL